MANNTESKVAVDEVLNSALVLKRLILRIEHDDITEVNNRLVTVEYFVQLAIKELIAVQHILSSKL